MSKKPEGIPEDVQIVVNGVWHELVGAMGRDAQEAIIARAILSAVEAERERWQPAAVYFERYCQDEAEDVENCVCGQVQHDDAKAFEAAIRNRPLS